MKPALETASSNLSWLPGWIGRDGKTGRELFWLGSCGWVGRLNENGCMGRAGGGDDDCIGLIGGGEGIGRITVEGCDGELLAGSIL